MRRLFWIALPCLVLGWVAGCASADETPTANDGNAGRNALLLAEQFGVDTAAINEGPAVNLLRTINAAQVAFLYSNGSYADNFDGLIDAGLVERQGAIGYTHEIRADRANGSYSVVATPDDPGGRHFYAGPDGVIRSEIGMPATADSTPF